jgi:hypothetical protein
MKKLRGLDAVFRRQMAAKHRALLTYPNPTACAVLERTADGVSVGRCYFQVVDGRCPRHGDVRKAQERYVETGRLTDESELPPR